MLYIYAFRSYIVNCYFFLYTVDNTSTRISCADTTLQLMMFRVNLLLKTTESKSLLKPLTF